MSKRKVIIEVDLDDDKINSVENLDREILVQYISGQLAKKYFSSLQDDLAQQVHVKKGSKKVHIKTAHFEFDFQAKRTLNELEKNIHTAMATQSV